MVLVTPFMREKPISRSSLSVVVGELCVAVIAGNVGALAVAKAGVLAVSVIPQRGLRSVTSQVNGKVD